MKTIEMKLYELKELKGKALEKASNTIAEEVANANGDYLEEDLKCYLKDNYKLEDVNLCYSLSHSQGDGVSFEMDNILRFDVIYNQDLEKANVFEEYILKNYSYDSKEMQELVEYLSDYHYINIVRISNSNYYHKRTCYVYCGDSCYNDILMVLATNLTNNIYYDICDKLEQYGYACLEVTQEDVEEYCESNDCFFTEDGEWFE